MRYLFLAILCFFFVGLLQAKYNSGGSYSMDTSNKYTLADIEKIQKGAKLSKSSLESSRWGPVSLDRIFQDFKLHNRRMRFSYHSGLPTITPDEFKEGARRAGFTKEATITLTAISMCESGLKPHAIGLITPSDTGILQFNRIIHRDLIREVVEKPDRLMEPNYSFKLASVIVRQKESAGRYAFEDWYLSRHCWASRVKFQEARKFLGY
jgi:hypothetical protein